MSSKPHNQPGQESSVRATPQQFDAIRSGAPAPEPHTGQIEKALADLPIRYELSPQDQWLLAEAQTELRGLEEQLEAVEKMVNHVFNVSGGGRWGPHGGWSECPICVPALAVFGIDAKAEAYDSNPAKERPLYTDGSLTATPLPPGAESFQDSSPANSPETPCAICRSYGHFTHNHPEGYENPMYDVLGADDPRYSDEFIGNVTRAQNQESEPRDV